MERETKCIYATKKWDYTHNIPKFTIGYDNYRNQ